ncbi:hypothetical protein U1839_13810 [Sphingomonas sp. RT2P30]|uniref:hypothetical protein n=1 Tax=Parasphingomonas halimpatiens TaxID=3096162 RepID=UPI002FC8F5A6
MVIFKYVLISVALAAGSVAGAADADTLQDQVLAMARNTRSDAFSFRRTMVMESTGSARKVVIEQFDPRRPAGAQWSLISVDGAAPTAKQVEQSRKAKRGPVPSYAQIAEWFGAPATRSDHAPGYVLYRFARLPQGALKIGSHDASADTQAEALVNTRGGVPFVEQVRLTSTKGFRMMLVALLQSMTISGHYRLLPDGHAVPADSASNLTGSLLGKAGQIKTTVTYTDFQKVR